MRVEESITQTDVVERTVVYSHEYTFPLVSLREKSYSIGFDASVEYMVEGSWYPGDEGSASAHVSITHPHTRRVLARSMILDDIKESFEDFFDRLREIFRLIIIYDQD